MHPKHIFTAIFIGAALVSCGSPVQTQKAQAPGYDPSNPSGAPPDFGNVVDSAGFFLKIYSDQAKMILHRADASYGSVVGTSGFSNACKIDAGATGADRDILCIAEVGELDNFASDLTVQFHVPRNMCKYLRHNPFHFWAYRPGIGPSQVVSWVDHRGDFHDSNYTSAGIANDCPYDYTAQGGPNCCEGKYQRVVHTQKEDGTWEKPTITENEWGGAVGNCLAGPATVTQEKTAGNLPRPSLYFVEGTGINRPYEIPALISQPFEERGLAGNAWSANFYQPSEHPTPAVPAPPARIRPADVAANPPSEPYAIDFTGHGANTFPIVNTNSLGDLPVLVPPLPTRPTGMRRPGGVPYLPSDTYEFACLDAAEEINYRIRLMIREWNYETIVENCVAGVNCPDEVGMEAGFPHDRVNDRGDWRDSDYPIYTSPATYVPNYPGSTTAL